MNKLILKILIFNLTLKKIVYLGDDVIFKNIDDCSHHYDSAFHYEVIAFLL